MSKASIILVLMVCCRLGMYASTGQFDFKVDSIEIRGRFPDSCQKPPYVFITKYDNSSGELGRVKVNANGEFVHRMAIDEPGEIVFRIGAEMYDFIATGKQTVYELAFDCEAKKISAIAVRNSRENIAYKTFYALRKQLKADLEQFKDASIDNPEMFEKFSSVMLEYQKQLSKVSLQFAGTFTAEHLCAADKLSESELASPATLRAQYLSHNTYADAYLYNTFLGPRLLANYLEFIRSGSDTSFAHFDTLLNNASVNVVAAKKLQFLLYEAFSRRHHEWLMKGYAQWAADHPDKMVQLIIKSRLLRIAKCLPGRKFIDVVLGDTADIPQSLSKSVEASKLTLLVFYSPSCSHCREELPKFIPLWQQYQNKGLAVYTVADTDNHDEWQKFIAERTGTGWINVREREDHYYNAAYVVSTTPAFVLIDAAGIIISRMASAEEMLQKIPALLDK